MMLTTFVYKLVERLAHFAPSGLVICWLQQLASALVTLGPALKQSVPSGGMEQGRVTREGGFLYKIVRRGHICSWYVRACVSACLSIEAPDFDHLASTVHNEEFQGGKLVTVWEERATWGRRRQKRQFALSPGLRGPRKRVAL